jgi:hypothetical protein
MRKLYTPKFIEEPVVRVLPFNGIMKKCFIVELDHDDVEKCKNFRTIISKKPGAYGKGLLNDKEPGVAEFVGQLGETAFGKVFHLPVDFSYATNGDKGDFKIFNGMRILDVKTSKTCYNKSLVQAVNESGRHVSLPSEIYVGAYLIEEPYSVVFVGWQTRKYLVKQPIVPGLRGRGHKNREIPYNEMLPMRALLEEHRNWSKGIYD